MSSDNIFFLVDLTFLKSTQRKKSQTEEEIFSPQDQVQQREPEARKS